MSEFDALVDSTYPGDLRLIGALSSPLLKINSVGYTSSIGTTGIDINITEVYKYALQPLDGTQKLDGNIYLSGYRQPRLP